MRALISKALTGSMIAGAALSVSNTEQLARHLFEREPHRHPAGHIPNWDIQPSYIKDVFRKRVHLKQQQWNV